MSGAPVERDLRNMTDREIIETLAVKVMGWKILPAIGVGPGTEDMVKFERPDAYSIYWWPKCEGADRGWNPLTSISDAFQVVEKMREIWFSFSIQTSNPPLVAYCKAAFSNSQSGEDFVIVDMETCRAICLAAIAAECAGEKQ